MVSIFGHAPLADWPPPARAAIKRYLWLLILMLISQAIGVLSVAWYTRQPFRWSTYFLLSYPVVVSAGLSTYWQIRKIRHPDQSKRQYGVAFLLTIVTLLAVWLAFLRWDISSRDSSRLLRQEIERSIQTLIGQGRVNLSSESLFVQVQRADFDDESLRKLVAQTPLLDRAAAKFFLLDLSGTSITDKGLQSLEALHSLEFLYLDNTKVTTNGLKVINQMPKLQVLSVRQTGVPIEHLNGLQQVRPRLQISFTEGQ